jgi:hypothetical protein
MSRTCELLGARPRRHTVASLLVEQRIGWRSAELEQLLVHCVLHYASYDATELGSG